MTPSPPSPSDSPDAGAWESAAPDDLVTISRWELEALRARASGEPDPAPAEAAPEAPRPPAPAAPPASPVADVRSAELERLYREAVRDRELATALAGRPLVPGAASQLVKLWRDDFDVFDEGGVTRVVARDGRPVAKAVAERLAEPEYAHFCPPPSRSGAPSRGTGRSGAESAPAPRTLGEAALLRWREAATSRPDPSAGPIGLRRR